MRKRLTLYKKVAGVAVVIGIAITIVEVARIFGYAINHIDLDPTVLARRVEVDLLVICIAAVLVIFGMAVVFWEERGERIHREY